MWRQAAVAHWDQLSARHRNCGHGCDGGGAGRRLAAAGAAAARSPGAVSTGTWQWSSCIQPSHSVLPCSVVAPAGLRRLLGTQASRSAQPLYTGPVRRNLLDRSVLHTSPPLSSSSSPCWRRSLLVRGRPPGVSSADPYSLLCMRRCRCCLPSVLPDQLLHRIHNTRDTERKV